MTSNLSEPAMEVPPEVLGRILAHLEKKDLKEVRLVCKKLERSAVCLLFDEVYISTNPAEIEIAQHTVRNFGMSIKTVFFSAVEYRELKWGHFKTTMRHRRKAIDHVKLAYENYCKLRQEQQEMLRAGICFGHLCYALRTVTNPQRFVMTDFEAEPGSFKWRKRRSRLWRVGDCPAHCSIQACACGNLEHLSNMMHPQSLLYRESTDTDPWSLVMMGLAATGSQIRELAIDSLFPAYVPRGVFDNTLQQPFALQDVFQDLAKLRLGFRINSVVETHIAQTLSTATKLKSLSISVEGATYRPRGSTAFHEILGECKFPRLKSLILTGFDSTEGEIIGFLRGSNHLQHLTLANHSLGVKEKWEPCANEIKAALPILEHIIVDALASGYYGQHVHLDCRIHRCSFTDVQGFFFHGKANPFICAHTQDGRSCVAYVNIDRDANRPPGA